MNLKDNIDLPKVLVISHNSFSRVINVGKFLSDTFNGWNVEKICQLYFYSEEPSTNVCHNYYRITDYDIINSIIKLKRNIGSEYHITNDCDYVYNDVEVKKGKNFKAKHPSLFRFFRDLIWRIGTWKNHKFNHWIETNKPDLIYFVNSDFEFPYYVMKYIKKKYRIPVFTSFEDDYYIYQQSKNLLDKYKNYRYRKIFKRVIKLSDGFSFASDIMKELYEKEFLIEGFVQHKSCKLNISNKYYNSDCLIFLYAGGLSLGRDKSLIEIADVLKKYSNAYLMIYTAEKNEKILEPFITHPRVLFKGFAPEKVIESEIANSYCLVFVESFIDEYKNRVKCSLSTKIAEYLGSRKCILAYGPKDVGSIDYLLKNKAAVIVDNPDEIYLAIDSIMNDKLLYNEVVSNSINLAKTNHMEEKILFDLFNNLKGLIEK